MRAWLILFLLLAIGGAAYHLQLRYPQHLPWTPLDLTAPVGWATHAKLARLAADPVLCRGLLKQAGADFEAVDDREAGNGCGWHGAVRLRGTGVPLMPGPVVVTCPVAAALTVWTRRTAMPAVEARLGEPLTSIVHNGSYNCRNIAGSANRSEHAVANAVDISGIRTAGTRISVRNGWHGVDGGGGMAAGALLEDLRGGGCRLFSVTLSPDYNAAHADHLHFDMGPMNTCR